MPLKRLLLVLPLVLSSACSSTFLAYKDTLSLAFFGAEPASYTKQQLLATSQQLMYVSVGDASRVSLELALQSQNQSTWRSGDKGGLVFVHHRLVRTLGFKQNLLQLAAPKMQPGDAISVHSKVGQSARLQLLQDDARYSNLLLESRIVGRDKVLWQYDDYQANALLITEQLASTDANVGFSVQQQYWFDLSTGQLLQTIQQSSPSMPSFNIVMISTAARLAPTKGTP